MARLRVYEAAYRESNGHVISRIPDVDSIALNRVVVVVHVTSCAANDRERMLVR